MKLFKRTIEKAAMYTLGIDIGSVATKALLFNGKIAESVIIPTGWSPRDAASRALAIILGRRGIPREAIKKVVATGYGRISIDYADKKVTEIACHAAGAHFLDRGIRAVLDIGGQDSKAISLSPTGAVQDFVMNDKCAAGTGRFLEVMAHLLGAEVSDLDGMAAAGSVCPITSMCTVFAESEIISLLAGGTSKESIACGILDSIAVRAAALLGRAGVESPVAFTGGVSKSAVLQSMIEKRIGATLIALPDAQIAGALGAALAGWELLGHRQAPYIPASRTAQAIEQPV